MPDGNTYKHHEMPSRVWFPMRQTGMDEFGECWENKYYYVSVRRYVRGFPIANSAYAIIGVSSIDETARHDWRDFQRIKNDIVGDEWEGVELYPSESRLKDPSNRFYLWCVPPGVIAWGLPGGRSVLAHTESSAPQRPFAD